MLEFFLVCGLGATLCVVFWLTETTTLDIAIKIKSPLFIKLISRVRRPPNALSLMRLSLVHDLIFLKLLRPLLEAKADVNARDRNDEQMLHWVSRRMTDQKNLAPIVDCLIRHRAEVDNFDQTWETPLARAAEAGFEETVELLLAAKANVNLARPWCNRGYFHARRLPCGDTPLDSACRFAASESLLTTLCLAGAESGACHLCRKRSTSHRLFCNISRGLRNDCGFPRSLPKPLVNLIQSSWA